MEEKITGRETTVGILDGEALPVVEVRPKQGSYDYNNKYTAGLDGVFLPRALRCGHDAANPGRGATRVQGGRRARLRARRRDGARGWRPVVLEVNTLPGMTETSLLPKAAAAAGLCYEELCRRMVDLALKRSTVTSGRKAGRAVPARLRNINQISNRRAGPARPTVPRIHSSPGLGFPMWFRRKPKNRRFERKHVLDVKLRSSQRRQRRFRRVTVTISCLLLLGIGGFGAWRGGEWGLRRLLYENPAFAIAPSRCRDRRRDRPRATAALGGREARGQSARARFGHVSSETWSWCRSFTRQRSSGSCRTHCASGSSNVNRSRSFILSHSRANGVVERRYVPSSMQTAW